MRALVLFSLFFLFALCAVLDNQFAVPLTRFRAEQENPGDLVWTLTNNDFSGELTANGLLPGFVVSPPELPWSEGSLKFDVSVKQTDDNDVIGFVFGYRSRDLHNIAADYLLLSWKRAAQNYADATCGGIAPVGLKLSRVRGTPSFFEFWRLITLDESCGRPSSLYSSSVTVLQNAINLGSTGWSPETSYQFIVALTSSTLTISVNGATEITIPNSNIPTGQYGFFSLSQAGFQISSVKATVLNVLVYAPITLAVHFTDDSPCPQTCCVNNNPAPCYGGLVIFGDGTATNSPTKILDSQTSSSVVSGFLTASKTYEITQTFSVRIALVRAAQSSQAVNNYTVNVLDHPPTFNVPETIYYTNGDISFDIEVTDPTLVTNHGVSIQWNIGATPETFSISDKIYTASHSYSSIPPNTIILVTLTRIGSSSSISRSISLVNANPDQSNSTTFDPYNCPYGCFKGTCIPYVGGPGGCACKSGWSSIACDIGYVDSEDYKKDIDQVCPRETLTLTTLPAASQVYLSDTYFNGTNLVLSVRSSLVFRQSRQFSLMKFLPATAALTEFRCNYPGPRFLIGNEEKLVWTKLVDPVRCQDVWLLDFPWAWLRNNSCFEGPVVLENSIFYYAPLIAQHADFLGPILGFNVTRSTEYAFLVRVLFPKTFSITSNVLRPNVTVVTPNSPSNAPSTNLSPLVFLTTSAGTPIGINSSIVYFELNSDVTLFTVTSATLKVRTRVQFPYVLTSFAMTTPYLSIVTNGTGVDIFCPLLTATDTCEQEWTVTFPVDVSSCTISGTYNFGWSVGCTSTRAVCGNGIVTFQAQFFRIDTVSLCPSVNLDAQYSISIITFDITNMNLSTNATVTNATSVFTGSPIMILFEISVVGDTATIASIESARAVDISIGVGGSTTLVSATDRWNLLLRQNGVNVQSPVSGVLSDPASEPAILMGTSSNPLDTTTVRSRFTLLVDSTLLRNFGPTGPDLSPLNGFASFSVNLRVEVDFAGSKKSFNAMLQTSSTGRSSATVVINTNVQEEPSSGSVVIEISWFCLISFTLSVISVLF